MLEQRNDSFKLTTAHAQSKVLTLEQEKAQLTTELSAAVSQVGTLQLEVGNLHKQESELKQQLASAMAEVQTKASEWAIAIQSQKGWSQMTSS
jgi:chromosome segregation ATPase